jgi:four helix bundle protein
MPLLTGFEELIAWKKGKQLYIELYKLLLSSKDYSFKDQMLRAALSITNNIAEGFDRSTKRELRQFLIISRGSAAEVRSMLILANELNTLDARKTEELQLIAKDIAKLLTAFIKSIDGKRSSVNGHLSTVNGQL